MARIRTVKPEFWTDEKVVECSIPARLLFIGLFNYANDMGCLERSPKRIKMQVFPADTIDCEPLIDELIAHGLLSEYSVNGSCFLHIKGFLKHQKINRPSATKIPLPPELTESATEKPIGSDAAQGVVTDDSLPTHGELTDGREKEGKGKDQIQEREAREPDEFAGSEDYAQVIAQPFGKFAISNDWLPGADFAKQATLWGIDLGGVPGYSPEELQQFRDYWSCEGKVKHQQQWEQTFAYSLRSSRARNRPAATGLRKSGSLPISQPDTTIPPGFRG